MLAPPGYLQATRHPYPCLLFLLPLVVGYEAGVWWLGGAQPEAGVLGLLRQAPHLLGEGARLHVDAREDQGEVGRAAAAGGRCVRAAERYGAKGPVDRVKFR